MSVRSERRYQRPCSPPGSARPAMHMQRSRLQHHFGRRSISRCSTFWARPRTRRSTGFWAGRRAARFVRTVPRLPQEFPVAVIEVPGPVSRNQGKAYQNRILELANAVPADRDFILAGNGLLTPGDAASVAATRRIEASALVRRAVLALEYRSRAKGFRRNRGSSRIRRWNRRSRRLSGAAARRTDRPCPA